ncbi:MCE family protein [Actinomadura darangshiensis]|uniref:MCE family protein n=1 Tax=Actinomadura darangshiensis TaxID=705336 RepID=A0A4R5C0L2_9ACTN|nr:MCE family protein [Actinomadura darangshiensis]TDD91766.1 MCE family protein [Actinomadura darangshiensis]
MRMEPPRRPLAAAMAVVLGAALSACSVLTNPLSSRTPYRVTAYFTRAVSFYPGSRVQVMGVNVGEVDSVTPVGGRVRVVASINGDVPLPATATAAIVPLSLIGERTLTFSPAWHPGLPEMRDGAVLQTDRTQVPVEVNDALKSFGKLLDNVDPAKADTSLGNAAGSLDGNGAAFNQAFQQAGQLVNSLAGQDQQLLKVAQNLDRLAGVVRGREKTLGRLVSDFAKASSMLSDERASIRTLVEAIADLARRGDVLIKMHQDTIPADLKKVAQVSLTLKGSSETLGGVLQALPNIAFQFVNAYQPENHAIVLRVTLDNFARSYLAAILREPTIDESVPCPLPPPYSNCQ